MKNLSIGAAIIALAFTATSAVADQHTKIPKTKYSIEQCIAQAVKAKPGTVQKSELKMEGKVPVYEFTIHGDDNKVWDVECNTSTGKLVEIEEQVASADDAQFKAKMKVSEEEARKTALAAYPGEVSKVEYEIESDGKATYEFDIISKDKKEMKIEVDATSGKIVEKQPELSQIGPE